MRRPRWLTRLVAVSSLMIAASYTGTCIGAALRGEVDAERVQLAILWSGLAYTAIRQELDEDRARTGRKEPTRDRTV